MALLTTNLSMGAFQFERETIMVNRSIVPIGRSVAGGAVLAVLTVVFIVAAMAGVTIRGCALVNAILVTLIAGSFAVLAFQFKGGKIVVETRRLPAAGGMAHGAILTEPALMRVV